MAAAPSAQCRSIPPYFKDHDAEFLSDLVLTAVAEAQRRAAEMLQAEMRKVPSAALYALLSDR